MFRHNIINFKTISKNIWNVLNTIPSKNNDPWITASSTKNYLKNDPLIDWLELYYCELGFNDKSTINKLELCNNLQKNDEYLNMIFARGIEFEDKVMNELQKRFKHDIVTINTQKKDGKTKKNFDLTKQAIFDGVPIIYQGVLFNENNKTNGTPDLLVRSDYINKLTNITTIMNDSTTKHYYVCEIKWSRLPLSSKNFIKNKSFFPAYKSQLAIYNCALGNIQGYFPSETFIFGKGWETNSNRCNNAFDKLGIINYKTNDIDIIQKTTDAISWLRDVYKHGEKWSPLEHPTKQNKNMFPNMCNEDLKWDHIKSNIAKQINEPTMISHVTPKHRDCMYEKKIYSIFDKTCTAFNMGSNCETIDNILKINRSNDLFLPKKIMLNDDLKKSNFTDMFIDFETLNTDFVKSNNVNIHNSETKILIYMIGIGYLKNYVWYYKSFCIESATSENEKKIVKQFIDFVSKMTNPRLFHWSQSEISSLKKISKNNNDCFETFITNTQFVDLYKIFTDQQIVVRGAYTYGLKSIGKALYKLNLVTTDWPNTKIDNGQNALFAGCKYYSDPNDEKNIKTFDEILKYNEIDCKMLHEILEFLRKISFFKK